MADLYRAKYATCVPTMRGYKSTRDRWTDWQYYEDVDQLKADLLYAALSQVIDERPQHAFYKPFLLWRTVTPKPNLDCLDDEEILIRMLDVQKRTETGWVTCKIDVILPGVDVWVPGEKEAIFDVAE